MQQNKKTKSAPETVVKPILVGDWNTRSTWKMAPKRTLSTLLIALVYVFFSVMASLDNPILRIIVSAAVILLVFYYQCTKGMEAGEKDAAYSEIMFDRQKEGKVLSAEDRDRCFHPLRGVFATLLGVLPFVIICLVYAFMAKPQTYQLGVIPTWMKNSMLHDEVKDALGYYAVNRSMSFADGLRIVVRCLTMPFINIAGVLGNDAVLWAERLSPLFVMIAPMGFGLGYSRGHALRTRINTGIQQGVDKKKRKEQKARRKRQRSSSPERLI